jgi:hypothetical protein
MPQKNLRLESNDPELTTVNQYNRYKRQKILSTLRHLPSKIESNIYRSGQVSYVTNRCPRTNTRFFTYNPYWGADGINPDG